MLTLYAPHYGEIEVPFWVNDLDSFRRWVHSGELPEKLKVHFVNGHVWMDVMGEALSHNQAKLAVMVVLAGLVRAEELGVLFPDGMLLTNDDADLGCEPDVMFVSAESLASGRVTFTQGETTGAVATEMVGSPDMVLEVVSPSSVVKDTDWLMTQYHDAGVSEYWLIDARRNGDPVFTIFRRMAKEFIPVRKSRGWLKSPVFGKSFRLVRTEQFGLVNFVLDVK